MSLFCYSQSKHCFDVSGYIFLQHPICSIRATIAFTVLLNDDLLVKEDRARKDDPYVSILDLFQSKFSFFFVSRLRKSLLWRLLLIRHKITPSSFSVLITYRAGQPHLFLPNISSSIRKLYSFTPLKLKYGAFSLKNIPGGLFWRLLQRTYEKARLNYRYVRKQKIGMNF